MEEKIKQIFKETLLLEEDQITDELSQDNCMDWDSMNHLDLITKLEKEFEIKFSVDDVLSMKDYKTVKERVEKQVND